jgi:hypothetical protein
LGERDHGWIGTLGVIGELKFTLRYPGRIIAVDGDSGIGDLKLQGGG